MRNELALLVLLSASALSLGYIGTLTCSPGGELFHAPFGAKRGEATRILNSKKFEASSDAIAQSPSKRNDVGSSSIREMSRQMKDIRAEIEKDSKVKAYIEAMRGAALSDFDAAQTDMRLIEFEDGDDSLPLEYDPAVLEAYYAKRPFLITKRFFQLSSALGGFLASLISDAITGKLEKNEVKRVAELREAITSLGPFYIKLGQALSIRPDILSPQAMVELQRLCDKVPSYDSKIAFEIMERELGCPISDVFSEISPEPLAAASLGQVYKATLRSNGAKVAVKVQRPGVLETVSLDLHLARQLGYLLKKIPFLEERTDLVALLDEFAFRFYEELDYNKEVVVPTNYPEYTSRRVFTSEWIEGEKLSQSKADDVQTLVSAGVLAYLTQLLDSGFFHADPHPGNLIRTPDGKLALLDFGLMTEVTEDQKYGMIEAISHLVHRDYSSIGDDFKRLDFIPGHIDVGPIVPALTNVFDAALAGGGAKSINFQELAGDLAQITFEYPFRIPPYFALVIRAIGVLEGIALVGNPSFAIIDEAYPYISKRLLTDESPRLRAALRYMIYGKSDVFDVERLIDLLQAFESFAYVRDNKASESAIVNRNGADMPSYSQTREALRFLFSSDGSFFRDFLLDEVVKGADCLGRDAVRELAYSVGFRGPNIPSVFKAAVPKLSPDERKIVDNTRKLISFFLGDTNDSLGTVNRVTPYSPGAGLFGLRLNIPSALSFSGSTTPGRFQAELTPILRELGPEMRSFGFEIVGRLTEKLASRVLRYASDRVLANYYGSNRGSIGDRFEPRRDVSEEAKASRFYS